MSNPVQNYINQINNIKIPENENNILNFLTTLDSNNQKMYLSFILSQSHIFDAMHQILETQNHKDFYRKAGYSDKTGNIVPKIDQDGKVFFEEFTSWDDTNKECREILNSLQNGDKQKWLEFVQYIKSIYEPNKMDIYFNPKNNKLHEDILVDFSRLNYSLHDNDLLKKQLEEINNNPAVIHEKGILNRIKGFISKIKTDRKHKQIKSKIQGDTAFVEKALNLIEKYKNNPDVTAITKKHLDFSEQLIKADLPKEVLSKVLLGLSYSPQSSSFSNNKIFEMEKHLSASAKIAQKMFSPEIVYAPNLQDMTKEIRNLLATYEIKEFVDKIAQINDFEKENILNEKFILEDEGKIKIYYAPHNKFINTKAQILIIGITPGWTQTQIAFKTANEGLTKNKEIIDILKKCKYNSRFSGSMRNNLIDMLDEIGLNRKLNISSCSEMFNEENNLMHTTSLIKYPVFINGKNYNGHNPEILKNEVLFKYVQNYFINEIKELQNTVIIPLGKAVEEVLKYLVNNFLIDNKYTILYGFPHPSGANGHRKEIFENNKEALIRIVNSIN